MLVKALRVGLGNVIVFIDWLTRPKKAVRSQDLQQKVQDGMSGLSLYQLYACPFCVKTRRALHALNVQINISDIGKNLEHREELAKGGGRVKVPCLRIESPEGDKWLYESDDIIKYLRSHVSNLDSAAV